MISSKLFSITKSGTTMLFLTLAFAHGVQAQEKAIVGSYNSCVLEDCLSSRVLELLPDQKVLFSSFMEGKRYKPKEIGLWGLRDSLVTFELVERFAPEFSDSYVIKHYDEFTFLISEGELAGWEALVTLIQREIMEDETIVMLTTFTYTDSTEAGLRQRGA